MNSFFDKWNWQPPAHWTKITTVEMHTGGEPLRVFTSGLPPIEGQTVCEKRRYFREHYDYIRTGTMWEPRGHADMYGAVLTPSSDADVDAFFLHNDGYSTMCGHAIIALTKLLVETGLVRKEDSNPELSIGVPAGKVRATAKMKDGNVEHTSFRNVPSFVYLRDEHIDITGIGRVQFDIAFGGAFYAIVDAASVGLELTGDQVNRQIELGRQIKRMVSERIPIKHPFEEDLSFLYGTIFTGPAHTAAHHSRNVCIFADGQVDRSATGTGVSARAALHHEKGDLRTNQEMVIESIVGSTMTVRIAERTTFGSYDAIVPEVTGTASIIGQSEFYFDADDPFESGFFLR